VGHVVGLHFHDRLLHAESAKFYRVVGIMLLVVSMVGLVGFLS
jgi:hypothetical protein